MSANMITVSHGVHTQAYDTYIYIYIHICIHIYIQDTSRSPRGFSLRYFVSGIVSLTTQAVGDVSAAAGEAGRRFEATADPSGQAPPHDAPEPEPFVFFFVFSARLSSKSCLVHG